MPTIVEKLAQIESTQPEQYNNVGLLSTEYLQWLDGKNGFKKTVACSAYSEASAEVSDLQMQKIRAEFERNKAQKIVDSLEAKLKVAEHVVAILGSVEVP